MAYFTASVDPLEGEKGNKAFAESLGADYPILSDPTKETAKAYGVVHDQRQVPERWNFYIGKDGKILLVDRGADNKGINPRSAGPDVVAKLKELGVAQKN